MIYLKDIIESAKSNPNYYPTYHFEKIWRAIAKGKLLPKGHGRLMDADEIQFENAEFDTYGDYSRAFDAIDEAETIIEADKAESEE